MLEKIIDRFLKGEILVEDGKWIYIDYRRMVLEWYIYGDDVFVLDWRYSKDFVIYKVLIKKIIEKDFI